ncbi:Fic family protein [Pararhizobium sp. BT-229]|uniref:Fic family protein n=1 Tax=Pararhizobium sp. BT-229 TaxID=2986923 RepID=UPI0021F6A45C|nr:Fic family protein [Pararhizobium sp. BT-229]MCV9964330.1 Fic family protein [Pararhizobium sp. BT-229]
MRAAGTIDRIREGVYFRQAGEPMETEIRRSWATLVARLVPEGVVSDRTSIETKPVRFPGDDTYHVFVSSPRSRATIQLPGLSIHIRKGAGVADGDIAYMGTHLAGLERRLLDNLAPSRARDGHGPRTLGDGVVEAKLDDWCRTSGPDHLIAIRNRAAALAPVIGRQAEFDKLDAMVDMLLNLRHGEMKTRQGRARASGMPLDIGCVDRLAKLTLYLSDRAPYTIANAGHDTGRLTTNSFMDAYFSNYIEGIDLNVEQARAAVFESAVPEGRRQDGQDVVATYAQLIETGRPPSADDFPSFRDELRSRHARLMRHRPEVRPGQFKEKANRAGDTVFVAPDLLDGTLKEGHAIMRSIDDPFRRAVFLHYLLAETHPFSDGNGRLSRILMNRELLAAGLSRVVVPTVFRHDYIDALRALSRRDDPSVLVRSLEFCQRVTAACSANTVAGVVEVWAQAYAFCENPRHARLTMPNPASEIIDHDGVHAPTDYWQAVGHKPVGHEPWPSG